MNKIDAALDKFGVIVKGIMLAGVALFYCGILALLVLLAIAVNVWVESVFICLIAVMIAYCSYVAGREVMKDYKRELNLAGTDQDSDER